MATDTHEHAHSHHITPIGQLAKVFVFLTILMVATIAWAQFALAHPEGALGLNRAGFSYLNNIVAMGIAAVKAIAVIQIFMGVKFASNAIKTYAILGFVWFTLMFIMFTDYGTRHWEAVKGWSKESPLAMPRADLPYEQSIPSREEILNQPHTESSHESGH